MANVTKSNNSEERSRVSVGRVIMYTVLIGYALISFLPLFVMFSTSLMNLGEVLTGRLVPRSETVSDGFSGCILFTNDTFQNEDGDVETRRRFIVDITEEAADLAGQGIEPTSQSAIRERNEIFRIPFFTNYCSAWSDASLGEYSVNSIILVAITITGMLLFTPPAAYAFARMEFAGKDLIFGIMLATLMVPEMVVNLPNFLIVQEFGWFNRWQALTIPFMVTPFTVFLMRQQFATIPMDLWDAARMDGAGHVRFLWQVVLPLSRSVLLVVVLFAFIGGWNALAWPILVTQGDEWRPIAYGLQSFLNEEGNFGHLRMAGAVIAALPVLLLYAFTQRYFVEGLSTTGLKG